MSKPLTRSFRQLVRRRAARDPEFRDALLPHQAVCRRFLGQQTPKLPRKAFDGKASP